MDLTPISPAIDAVLRASDWTPRRRIDPTEYLDALRADGYRPPIAVASFLEHLGGLRVSFKRRRTESGMDAFTIDPIVAVDGLCRERVEEEYERRCGTRLFPVGEVHSGNMVVLQDSVGRLYGAYDAVFVRFGASLMDSLETILLDRDAERIR